MEKRASGGCGVVGIDRGKPGIERYRESAIGYLSDSRTGTGRSPAGFEFCIFEDEQKGTKKETGEKKSSAKRGGKKEEESAMVTGPVEKTTLGDIEELAALKEKLAGK